MKDGLDNIDELFKQTFDGFEANVDPSVWTNVQNAIGAGASGTDITPKADPTTVTTIATKSVISKIAVGVALVGTLGTAGYFVVNSNNTNNSNETSIAENTVTANPIAEEKTIENVQPAEVEATENKEVQPIVEKVFENKVATTTETPETKVEEVVKSNQSNTQVVNTSVRNEAIEVAESSNNQTESTSETVTTEKKETTTTNKVSETAVKETPSQEIISVPQAKPIKKEAEVDLIPNVITPNGDGENDVIKITGKNLSQIEVAIMDKTGKPVYRITSFDDEWAGKDQAGFDLIPGVYYMAGIVKDSDGNIKNIKQAINLFK